MKIVGIVLAASFLVSLFNFGLGDYTLVIKTKFGDRTKARYSTLSDCEKDIPKYWAWVKENKFDVDGIVCRYKNRSIKKKEGTCNAGGVTVSLE